MTNAPSPSRKYHRWTIGDCLAVARKTITTNQAEFAELVGMSTPTVSRYETEPDRYLRKSAYLRLWSNVTGFDIEWLLTGREPEEMDGPDGGGSVVQLGTRKRRRDQESTVSRCTREALVAA